jgi:hypothetical protein
MLFLWRLAADGFMIHGGPLDDGLDISWLINANNQIEVHSTLSNYS